MKKRVIVLLCVCSLLAGTFTGCSGQQDKRQGTMAAPEETQPPVDYNEDSRSNLGAWGRAMGSVLIYLNDGNPYYFGGYEATKENREAAADILQASWHIKNRKDLLRQIRHLLKTGDRKAFRREAREMRQMEKKELKTAMRQLSGDLLVHYQMVRYNWKTWKKKGLLAWDLCRVSHLVQWGYIAGYVSREEAQALIGPAAKKLKKNFSNWEEVQNNWLDGFCLFAGIDRKAANTDYTNRKALYETLKAQQAAKEKPLYDDSLFTAEIKPVPGVSGKAVFKEISKKKEKKKKNSPKPQNRHEL